MNKPQYITTTKTFNNVHALQKYVRHLRNFNTIASIVFDESPIHTGISSNVTFTSYEDIDAHGEEAGIVKEVFRKAELQATSTTTVLHFPVVVTVTKFTTAAGHIDPIMLAMDINH